MTETFVPSSPEELLTKLLNIRVFDDLPREQLLWFVPNARNAVPPSARSLCAKAISQTT